MLLRFGMALDLTTALQIKNSMESSYGCGRKAQKKHQTAPKYFSVCLPVTGWMYLVIFATKSCRTNSSQ